MEKPSEKKSVSLSRRGLSKTLILGTGGIAAANWSKPVVESVILPAHAQTSAAGGAQLNANGFILNAVAIGVLTFNT